MYAAAPANWLDERALLIALLAALRFSLAAACRARGR